MTNTTNSTTRTPNFACIQWPVRDLEHSLAWYRDILGLELTFPFTPGDNEAWLDVGGVGLGLIRCPDAPRFTFPDLHGTPQPLLQFQVTDIHTLHRTLRDQGLEVSDMLFKPQGGHSFTLPDPDGHLLSLWGGWPTDVERQEND